MGDVLRRTGGTSYRIAAWRETATPEQLARVFTAEEVDAAIEAGAEGADLDEFHAAAQDGRISPARLGRVARGNFRTRGGPAHGAPRAQDLDAPRGGDCGERRGRLADAPGGDRGGAARWPGPGVTRARAERNPSGLGVGVTRGRRPSVPPARWATARLAYARGEGSLRAIARRFKINPSAVMERAAVEGWADERDRCLEEARRLAIEAAPEDVADLVRRHCAVAASVVAETAQRLRFASELSASELYTLARTLQLAAPLERLSAGIEPSSPVRLAEVHGSGGPLVIFEVAERPAPPGELDEQELPGGSFLALRERTHARGMA